MMDSNNTYLFLAYSLVWVVFMIYAWILARRHSRLRRELDILQASFESSAAPGIPSKDS